MLRNIRSLLGFKESLSAKALSHSCHLLWPLQAEDLKDKLLRTLADMENLRERTARTSAETKQFAVQVSLHFSGSAAASNSPC